jgi:hypothetical protein
MNQLDELIEDKLPIKYILGIEKEFETYPDAFDIVYAYILKIKKNPERYKGTFTKHGLITWEFPGCSIDNIDNGLKKAIELGLLECTNETEDKEAYKIILNPFS